VKFASKSAVLVGIVCAAALNASALADGSSVAPTRLAFSKGHVSSYLTITNSSASQQRYSVAAYVWDQTDRDPIALSESDDVIFFPGSFTSEPFGSQRIRIGTVASATSVEKTYRVVVSELPPLAGVLEPRSIGLTFTTSYSVPIYVAPLVPSAAGEISNVVVDRNDLRFTIGNIGNVHFVAKAMRVSASGDAGTLFSTQNSAWFVLAGKQRAFSFPIPHGSCAAIKSVSIDVDAEIVKFDRTVIPVRSCG
jgi:P pilus assembly chaperone PapD